MIEIVSLPIAVIDIIQEILIFCLSDFWLYIKALSPIQNYLCWRECLTLYQVISVIKDDKFGVVFRYGFLFLSISDL